MKTMKKKPNKKIKRKIETIFSNALRSVKKRSYAIKPNKQKLLKKLYLKNLMELDNYHNNYPKQYNKLLKCKTVKKFINGKKSRQYVVEQVCRI
jgi:hypothetical protein|tara:strand:- start:11492 stop:11773 length:282 start_codon:yes stop_codon:yes gene_type:complete